MQYAAQESHPVYTDPLNVELHRSIATAMREAGDTTGATAHEVGIETFQAITNAGQSDFEVALYNIATVYSMRRDHARARRWFEITLALKPDLAIAHQNLAVVLDATGHPEAALAHRDRAYGLQRVFAEPAEHTVRRVLVLCAGSASGNIPIDTLLPPASIERIKYVIDYAADAEDLTLPPYDLVFNTIGEPDIAGPLMPRLERFAARCSRPFLNRPAAVMRTQRHRLPELLDGINDVLVPPCIRLEAMPQGSQALARELVRRGIGFPVLSRVPARHGGVSLKLNVSMEELWGTLDASGVPAYLTVFRDYRSADGFFRKYRMVFVGGEPYPYHLAISPQWLVHYFSADMLAHPWKLAEERRFLEDSRAALGERAMRALAAIGKRMELDYAGIDFTLMPDGQLLVFEANATMLVHGEAANGVLAYKNAFVQRIADAFDSLQAARMSQA